MQYSLVFPLNVNRIDTISNQYNCNYILFETRLVWIWLQFSGFWLVIKTQIHNTKQKSKRHGVAIQWKNKSKIADIDKKIKAQTFAKSDVYCHTLDINNSSALINHVGHMDLVWVIIFIWIFCNQIWQDMLDLRTKNSCSNVLYS